MFSGGASQSSGQNRAQGAAEGSLSRVSEQGMVDCLLETGRYRILKKLEPRAVATTKRAGFPLRGVITDTETTGLSHRKDEIIEIGVIAFSFDHDGNIGDVTGVYGGMQQPTVTIPSESAS